MRRSMYSGVAGLKTHQTKMDVIGNNIANVNTVAYKSQSVTFSELMYQTTQSASGANTVTGTAGTNARQIGLGVKAGAINTAITSEGASQTTNNPFDIRITGDSFFVVSNGSDNFFTRDGSFYVDGAGNLAMTSNGYNVMGWQVDPDTQDIKMDTVSALRIMSPENMTYPPEATTRAYVSGIIDKNDSNVTSASGKSMNLMFYDKLGYSYTAKMIIKDTDVDGNYTVQLGSIVDSDNNPLNTDNISLGNGIEVQKQTVVGLTDAYEWQGDNLVKKAVGTTPAETIFTRGTTPIPEATWDAIATAYGMENETEFKSLKFTGKEEQTATDGTVTTVTGDVTMEQVLNNATGVTGFTNTLNARDLIGIDAAGSGNTMNGMTASKITQAGTVSLTYNSTTGKFSGIGGEGINDITLSLSNLEPAGRFEDITINFATTTMFNNGRTSTIAATNGDTNKIGSGRKLGKMSGVAIQDDGRIYASYDNGQSKLLGQIAVAEFANASGLEKEGDNLYKASQNSGDFDGIGIGVKSNGGYMTTGVLEMSNVDLSAEFTEMITTQRGFQANSRIITVSDTLLEELVNLKR